MCICQRIEEGEQYNQCRQSGDGGRIDTGKLTDEKFCRRFALGGILHQFQYTGKSTFLEGFGDLDAYDFVGRNHSGKHFPALADVAGNTFSRQCGGVEGGNFVQHRSVQGDALSGFYFDGFAYLHTLGASTSVLPFLMTVAVSGRTSSRALMLRLALSTALS